MDPIVLRSLERVLAILAGGMAIYLGYRLFLLIPEQRDSRGRVRLPGGISIYMTRIGPGAFFALFGAIVIGLSFHYAMEYSGPAPTTTEREKVVYSPPASDRLYYTGIGENATAWERDRLVRQLQLNIHRVNALRKLDLPQDQRSDLELIVPMVKLGLMREAWQQSWGNFQEFQRWVLENNAAGAAPAGLRDAAALYHGKGISS